MTGRIEVRHHALIVWNDNPGARNALTPDYYAVLHEALNRAAADGDVGAVILAGAGGYFSSGGDLSALATRADLPKRARAEKIEALHDVVRAIRACPIPVISAVEGGAAGAGFALALACDIVVAAEDAQFAAAFVRAGLTPDGGLTHSLARLLPPATVLPLLLHGDSISAARLYALGAISDLTPSGGALGTAREHAHRLGHGPRATQMRIKALAHTGFDRAAEEQLDAERDAMARAQGTPEAAEGISAFLEKRRPDWGKYRK